MLSEWILAGTDHIEQVAPGMIQGAIQKTVYKKVYTKLNTDQRQVQKAFEDATRLAASETDPDKKKQYEQVAAQMQKLMSAKTKLSTQLIKAAKTAGSKIKHVFTTDVNDLNQEMKEKGAQRREEKRQERAKKKAQANPEPSKASQAAKATGRFVGKSFKHVFTDQIKIGKKKEDDVTYI
jgi:predicted RNA-binding Zn ribbon-like protein